MPKKYYYQYKVQGNRGFPLDQLRYDHAWPYGSDDAFSIFSIISGDTPFGHMTQVMVMSNNPPTKERWASFGWHVIEEKKFPVS